MPRCARTGDRRRSRFCCNHNWPFLAPKDTTRKSAPLAFTGLSNASRLISSTVPNPGSIEPTQRRPADFPLIFSAATAATPAAPPNQNTVSGRAPRSAVLSSSKRSDPLTLFLMGSPSRRAIQTIGMPSAVHRSLSSSDSLNSESDRLVTRKLRLAVESRKGSLPRAAALTVRRAAVISIASIGIPRTQ